MNDAPAALRYLVNGYETTGLVQYRSGDPLTITSSSSNNSGAHQNRDRAVYSGSSAYGGSACASPVNCRNFLNPAAFSVNPVGTFGNVQEGCFQGPGLHRLGCQHRAHVSIQRADVSAVPRRVLQPVEPHQPRRPRHRPGRVVWQSHQHRSSERESRHHRKRSAHRSVFVEVALLTHRGVRLSAALPVTLHALTSVSVSLIAAVCRSSLSLVECRI